MTDICDICFYSNIPITICSILFFVYSNIQIADYENSSHDACRDFLYYNITHLALILCPVLVMGSFICCNKICTSGLYVANAVLVIGQLIDKYSEDNKHCDASCEQECQELVGLSDKINICLWVIGGLYLLSGVAVVYKLGKCCCGSK